MKAVITIFQCKRVVLPYIFIRYCLPKMQQIFPGEMKVFLIQHLANVSNLCMQSGDICDSKLDLVKQWSDDDKFSGAEIIRHAEVVPKHPALPSYRIGVETALREHADFHVWLEDDALIFDEECSRWSEIIGEKDVGVYRPRSNFIHVAYLVSRPDFDKRILEMMETEELWDIGSTKKPFFRKRFFRRLLSYATLNLYEYGFSPPIGHVEYFMTKACKTKKIALNANFAARFHQGIDPQLIINMVKKVAPSELSLLKVDFESELSN